jgi:hypothetical protein
MLQEMLDKNLEDSDFVAMSKKRLIESRQYLETDYLLHVKPVSRVADHCIRHALSDPVDEKFATQCATEGTEDSHHHDMMCDRCESLKTVLGEIQEHVMSYNLPEHEKERTRTKYLAAETAIMEMRRHQLRSVLSSRTRKDLIEQLAPDEAFITVDWAMKWLPTKSKNFNSF